MAHISFREEGNFQNEITNPVASPLAPIGVTDEYIRETIGLINATYLFKDLGVKTELSNKVYRLLRVEVNQPVGVNTLIEAKYEEVFADLTLKDLPEELINQVVKMGLSEDRPYSAACRKNINRVLAEYKMIKAIAEYGLEPSYSIIRV